MMPCGRERRHEDAARVLGLICSSADAAGPRFEPKGASASRLASRTVVPRPETSGNTPIAVLWTKFSLAYNQNTKISRRRRPARPRAPPSPPSSCVMDTHRPRPLSGPRVAFLRSPRLARARPRRGGPTIRDPPTCQTAPSTASHPGSLWGRPPRPVQVAWGLGGGLLPLVLGEWSNRCP